MTNSIFDKYKLLIIITILLSFGFFITSFFSYKIAVDLTKNELRYKSLPLSSDNIYSEIQRDLLKANLISSLMAHDTFMIDWIKSGEKDVSKISSYLAAIKDEYNISSSFLVSDKTKNYYYPKGILKQIDPKEKRDEWFYRVKDIIDVYESNIDTDFAQNDSVTIFTNYRVEDKEGKFLAAIGVGLKTSHVSKLLNTYKKKYNHNIYFLNKDYEILIASKNIGLISNENRILMKNVISNFNKDDIKTHEYLKEDKPYIANVRFIDELDLYLFVETSGEKLIKELENTFILNIFMFVIIIIIIMLLIIYYINNSHNILYKFANTDKLTSLNNRNNFDKALKNIFYSNKDNLSLILFDIDNFKKINDQLGHHVGDKVLVRVSTLFKKTFREHDLIARWGGDEFIALLPNTSNESAYKLSNRLRIEIQNDKFLYELLNDELTISVGVITKNGEKNIEEIFINVDKNLYKAKQEGRNRVSS